MIEISNICKKYGDTPALDDINMTIGQGSIYALVGPNGAGKSTLLKILTGIIKPDGGRISYRDNGAMAELKCKMGYLPEQRGLYPDVTIGEQLMFFARLKGLDSQQAKAGMQEWLKRFEITSWKNHKPRELSKGMQQKVQIIACLIHHPELIFMDEPFTGIDPANLLYYSQIIKDYQQQSGCTIVISTHHMASVEHLCTDIAFIFKAHLVEQGSVQAVQKRLSPKDLFRITMVPHGSDADQVKSQIIRELSADYDFHGLEANGDRWIMDLQNNTANKNSTAIIHDLTGRLASHDILSCGARTYDMNDVFISLCQKHEDKYQ